MGLTTQVMSLAILVHFLLVATVSLDTWHHHICFCNGRDWCHNLPAHLSRSFGSHET